MKTSKEKNGFSSEKGADGRFHYDYNGQSSMNRRTEGHGVDPSKTVTHPQSPGS